jgi:hypothetical protein
VTGLAVGCSRREGSLDVLIDGAEALPRLVAELEQPESRVHIAGWYFSPDFALRAGESRRFCGTFWLNSLSVILGSGSSTGRRWSSAISVVMAWS